ncbi:MAG: hypothetical protein QQN41_05420 [Nitrosopumilus sp.]
MFKSIYFSTQNKQDSNNPIDIGWLVECMFFYERTTVIANTSILVQLFRYFGIERIIELIEEGLIQLIYTESHVGIITNTINGVQYHDTCQFTSPQHTYQNEIRKICIEVKGSPGRGRRAARRIEDKIEVQHHENIIFEGARNSFVDQNYISLAAKQVLASLVPELPELSSTTFSTNKTPKGIEVISNINFDSVNKIYHKRVSPSHSTITPALILSHLLDVESELYFSSNNLSEIAASSLSAKLIEQKISYVLEKSKNSAEKIENFQGFVFKNSKAIREAVNSNTIDIDELIVVLKKSMKFKEWLVDVNPDEDLINSYYSEVTKETVIDKLPCKSVRWGIFTGLGILADTIFTGGLGTASGIALGALDTFYLDKLIHGWKPNHFIEDDVKKLIKYGT